MYQTSIHTFTIGGIQVSIEKVTNIDELFDCLLAKGDHHADVIDERIPYWAELWPSALALSDYITNLDLNWNGLEVHEIGAGLGLPSIVTGKLGGRVTISDYLPEAIAFAKSNWNRNIASPPNFKILDWRNPYNISPADVLLAADVAYEQRMFKYLPNAFRNLCKKGGLILLSEPNRAFAQSFLANISSEGLQLQRKIQMSQTLFGQEYLINILELRNL